MKQSSLKKIAALLIFTLLSGITQLHAATITSTAQGGLWGEPSTWIGGKVPTKDDHVIVTSVVTTGNFYYSSGQYDMINLTINTGGKVIREEAKAGRCLLNISGNLTNNGEIVDYKDFFDISILGNIENNGILKPRIISLLGANQHISGNKPISSKTLNLQMTDTFLTAASDLHFHNCDVNGNSGKTLNMKNFKLKLTADSITYSTYYGTVYSACEVRVPLIFNGTGTIEIDKAFIGKTIQGNVVLKSPSYAFMKDLTVEGNFTIEKGTKASSYANLTKLIVKGNFTNNGVLNNDTVRVSNLKFAPRSLYLTIYGNSLNNGSTGISKLFMTTNGNALTIQGNYTGDIKFQQAEGTETPGGKVVINDGVDINGKIEVYAPVEIMPGGALNLKNRTFSPIYMRDGQGQLINNGSIYRYHYVNNSWSYRNYANQPATFVDYELREWEGTFDGMDVEVHNGTTYPGLTGSTLRWWRLKSVGEGKIKYYTIKFYYDESLLNGQKEENLKVFRTADEGQTWEPVSVREGAVLDTVNNFISIGSWSKNATMLTEFGDFVISAGDGTVPLESNIKVDMIGRPDVRVGAPNPFSIHVYNITNQRTKPILLAMDLGEDVRFKEVRLPYNDGVEIIPIDSIGDPKDQTQVFFIPYLDPNEHYTFDVIVYGVPEHLKSTEEDLVTILTGGFFGNDDVKSGAVDYMVDWVGEKCEFNESEEDEYNRGLNVVIKDLDSQKQQYGKTVSFIRDITKDAVGKVAETNPITNIIFKVGEGVEAVSSIKDKLRRRLFHWFYKEVGLYGVEEKVASGKQVEGKLVASWDPNEIVGPAGYGEQNYLAEIPTMNYTIFFENKKEATAPAYRVQIVDTLSAAFNPETVKFAETSHMGAQYNWKMVREGNILKWDIEGIELMPNITPPEGEGFVKFSVELNDALPTGTEIKNRAIITFDMNPPIVTNTWVNILDLVAPTTTMNTIDYQAGDTILTVSCTATDNENGAGVGMYEFFASVDQNPFVSVGQSAQNSIEFQIPDSTKNNYRFYALVTDNVGNTEQTIPQLIECNSLLVSAKPLTNPDGKLSMYPNPVKDFVNIQLNEPTQKVYAIEIVSINGALQHSALYTHDQMQQGISIDTRHLRKGTYLLRVISEQQVETQKLIIK